jgi:hypothetical protein
MATAQGTQSKAAKSRQPARARASDTEELSGERDEHYNLISVLYHGLQGADQGVIYAADAEEAGDDELADFFRSVAQKQGDFARQAKQLLFQRLGGEVSAGRVSGKRKASASEDEDDVEGDDD